jgi:RNA polymerase sigma factor (sigma-70 family)
MKNQMRTLELKPTTVKIKIGAYETLSGQYKGTVVIQAENECPRVHIVNQAITYETCNKKPKFNFDAFRGLSYEKRLIESVLKELTKGWEKYLSALKDSGNSHWPVPLDLNDFYRNGCKGKIGEILFRIEPKAYMPKGWYKSLKRCNVSEIFGETCEIPEPDDLLEAAESRTILKDAMETLDPRYAKVLRMRFGLGENYGDENTLEETGKELKVTRERIRCMEAKALYKLKLNRQLRRSLGIS